MFALGNPGTTRQIKGIPKLRMKNAKLIFEKTSGYENVCQTLEDVGHVVIAGSPGSGKTTMALFLMQTFKKKKYQLQFFKTVGDFEFDRDVHLKQKTLLVFDDVFGCFSLTQDALLECPAAFKNIEEYFNGAGRNRTGRNKEASEGDLKVIFCTRTNILKHVLPRIVQFHGSLFRPSVIADLATLVKLSFKEKKQILKKHLQIYNKKLDEDEINKIAKLNYDTLGFPYICELFVKEGKISQKPALQFFKEPLLYLNKYFQRVFNDEKQTHIASVYRYMLLNDGMLDLVKLTDENSYSETDDLYESMKMNSSREEMKKAATDQLGTFITSEGDVVKFSHPTIHDAVAFAVGCREPIFILRKCSLSFIIERVKLAERNTRPSTGNEYDFTISLQTQSTTVLIKRLAEEIHKGEFALALSHHCLQNKEYALVLLKELYSKDNVQEVLHRTDNKHKLSFLFWVVFQGNNDLCEKLLLKERFEDQEFIEALLGSCRSGNLEGIKLLLQSRQNDVFFLDKVKSVKLEDILQKQEETQLAFHQLSSPHTNNAKYKDNRARMHGGKRDQLIHIATVYGFSDIVTALLNIGVDVNSKGGTGMTPLMYACYHGNRELSQNLLDQNADLNLLDAEKDNCLHLASRAGHPAIVELLLDRGIDIDSRGFHERTPLMFASQQGKLDVVQILLEKGADVSPNMDNITNKDKAIHLAARNGNNDIVIALLEKGKANIETVGECGRTALMYACRHGQVDTAKELYSRNANIKVSDQFDKNCLHLVARTKHIDTLKWLLSLKVFDKNCRDGKGYTPLMLACMSGHTNIVKYLIDEGADAEVVDNQKRTCSHHVCYLGLIDVANVLIEQKLFQVTAVDKLGRSPFSTALISDQIGIIELMVHKYMDLKPINDSSGQNDLHEAIFHDLLDKFDECINFADFNAKDYMEQTPLMLSVLSRKNLSFTSKLLEHGADINLCGSYGLTPIMTACRISAKEHFDLLLSKGADVLLVDYTKSTVLHYACMSRDDDDYFVTKLLQFYPALKCDTKNSKGQTPAMLAASRGSKRLLEMMIPKYASPHKVDNQRNSILHLACKCRTASTELIRFLTGFRLGLNGRNCFGETPLMLAAEYGNGRAVGELISKGASLDLTNSHGQTCLELAERAKHHTLAETLRRHIDAC